MNAARLLPLAAATIAIAAAGCGRKDSVSAPGAEPDVESLTAGEDVAPLVDPSEPFYVGVWAGDPSWCAIAPGSSDAAPIVITEGEFIGYENRCRIGAAEEGTEGGWRLELVCEAEGVEFVETVDFDIDGELLRMSRENGEEVALSRCPRG